MNEQYFRVEIYHMMQLLGFNPYHPPDMKQYINTAKYKTGKPDLFCLNPVGPTVIIEVKMFVPQKKNVKFDGKLISDAQRNWLDWWSWERLGYSYIAICTKEAKRKAWLIPWPIYVSMELIAHKNGFENGFVPTLLFDQSALGEDSHEYYYLLDRDTENKTWRPHLFHDINRIHTIVNKEQESHAYSMRFEKEE